MRRQFSGKLTLHDAISVNQSINQSYYINVPVSTITVISATGLMYRKWQISTPHISKTVHPILTKLETYNYLRRPPGMQDHISLRRRGWSGRTLHFAFQRGHENVVKSEMAVLQMLSRQSPAESTHSLTAWQQVSKTTHQRQLLLSDNDYEKSGLLRTIVGLLLFKRFTNCCRAAFNSRFDDRSF